MLAVGALSSLQNDATVGNKGSCTDDAMGILLLCGSLSQNSSSGKLDMVSVILPSFWGCLPPSCVELSDLCREYLSLQFIKIVWKIKIF